MTSALQHVVKYAIAIAASVSQDVFQDAINVIVIHAFAAHLYAIILVVAYASALLANAILEEDAFLHAIMYVTMIAKSKLYNIILFFWINKLNFFNYI